MWIPISEWKLDVHGASGWVSDGKTVSTGYYEHWGRDESGELVGFDDYSDEEKSYYRDQWCYDSYMLTPVEFVVKYFKPYEDKPAPPIVEELCLACNWMYPSECACDGEPTLVSRIRQRK